MASSVFDLLIANATSPNTDASDLSMTLSSKRLTESQIEQILSAVCDADIFKAATAAHSVLGNAGEKHINFVYEKLKERCQDPSHLTKAELLTILTYDDFNLFCRVIPKVAPEKIKDTFSKISTINACRFMLMCIDYGDEELIRLYENEIFMSFCDFDSRDRDALSALLPKLTQFGCAKIISRLLEFFTPAQLSHLYGEGFGEGIKDLITSGFESPNIWDAFFYDFFSHSHTNEELVTEGLWFLQLNATDESAAAACFFLYAMKFLGTKHPIFEYAEGFTYPISFTRKHTTIYEEEIKKRWENPKDLIKFLDATKLCNPFAAPDIEDKDKLLIKEEGIFSPEDYDLLSKLFENNVSCEDILKIFLNTFLKKRLVMEELLYISECFNVLDKMLAALENVSFEGFVEKYNIGDLVISPKHYYCKQLHVVAVNSSEFKYFNEENENESKHSKDKRAVAEYHISSFVSGQLFITLSLPESLSTDTQTTLDKSFDEIIATCKEVLSQTDIGEKGKKRLRNNFNFSENLFVDTYDFDLFTSLICEHSDKLDDILEILETAEWNSTFRLYDVRIESHFYTDFIKYRPEAVRMFKKLFAEGCDYNRILTLYFESIYKLIVPLQVLLIISEKKKMLAALSERTIYCNMPMKDKRLQCRPMTISCAPICTMVDADIFIDSKVPAKCVDYILEDGYIKRIIFENTATGVLNTRERGSWFGYIAANIQLRSTKKSLIPRLPDASEYDIREMVFILDCMETAIYLRKNSKEDLNQLIDAMGKKNPFAFKEDIRLDIDYLSKFFSKEKAANAQAAMAVVILNAQSIEEIEKVYLNTSFKYYLTLKDLISLIKARRFDLTREIDSIFSNVDFECAVDSAGYLWSPFIPQNTIKVDLTYGGSNILCRIYEGETGNMCANIISVQENVSPLNAVLPALMAGYTLSDSIVPTVINALVKDGGLTQNQAEETVKDKMGLIVKAVKLVNPNADKALLKGVKTAKLVAAAKTLEEMLQENKFNLDKFRSLTYILIKSHCDLVSVDEMETTLSHITSLFMQRFADDEEAVLAFLDDIFPGYSYFYRDNGIVDVWAQQLCDSFGAATATAYKEKIKTNERYIKNKKVF